jgi:hypothetical protein
MSYGLPCPTQGLRECGDVLFPDRGEPWEATLRFILYMPFYRTMNDEQRIRSVIQTVTKNDTGGDYARKALEAIDAGLSSNKKLSELLPQDQFTEMQLRQFLTAVRPHVEQLRGVG